MKDNMVEICERCGCFVGGLLIALCLILALGIAFGVFCFEGWIFLLLWNWIAVGCFSAPILGYWVCVGIVFGLNFIGRSIFGRTKIDLGD